MATGWNIKIPMYISSTGASKEGRIYHDGADLKIDTDAGKIKFGNKTISPIVMDVGNQYLGVGSGITPSYQFHAISSDTFCRIQLDYTSGPSTILSSTSVVGFSGTVTGHNFRLLTNGIYRIEIDQNGLVYMPYVDNNDIAGDPGLKQLYINDSGELGYSSSMSQTKENVTTLSLADIDFIKNLNPVKYDVVETGQSQHGFIAEEVDQVFPEGIFLSVFKVTPQGYEHLKKDVYQNIVELRDVQAKNVPVAKVGKKITAVNSNGEPTATIDENIEVELHPAGVNIERIVPALVRTVQDLISRIEALEAT